VFDNSEACLRAEKKTTSIQFIKYCEHEPNITSNTLNQNVLTPIKENSNIGAKLAPNLVR
jgi:hypothetical protein